METLLKKLQVDYNDITLYKTALTHPSYVHEHKEVVESNQRLEFLGDAIFDLVVSEHLFNSKYISEGMMTKLRATYVCEKALSTYVKDLGMKKYILVGKGEKVIKNAVMADAFEAFVAAIYNDCGLIEVQKFFNNHIKCYIENEKFESEDYKSRLQEVAQSDKRSITYQLVKQEGPSHDPSFYVDVYMNEILMGSGRGNSKKLAEQMAAKNALAKLA